LSLETRKAASHLEDPGAEMLDRMTTLWTAWGRWVLIALGAAAAIGAGVFFWMRSRETAEAEASRKLTEANVLFWQGDYARSLELAKQVGAEHPGTATAVDAHRLAGDDAYWSGDFATAITEYRAYLDQAPKGMLADAVNRSLAYALESGGNPAEAAPIYARLVGTFDRESSAEFLYAAARCERTSGKTAEAIAYLERLTGEFGETSFAPRARLMIAELQAPAR
jgi:TolA-binding protein